MQYFVSAENKAYYHWQLELLIESFKANHMADSLTIALAESEEPVYINYCRNIKDHSRIFIHENYPGINRIYSLCQALDNGIIHTPLTIIHPDMLFIKPVEQTTHDITFQISKLEKPDLPIITEIQKVKNTDVWFEVGGTIYVQWAGMAFFKRILEIAEFLKNENLAWAITMLEHLGHLSYHGTFEFESQLPENVLKNFVHYNRGLPPHFSKKMFKFEPPNVLGLGDPFEVLANVNSSKVTDYVKGIIKSYENSKTLTNALSLTIPIVKVETK